MTADIARHSTIASFHANSARARWQPDVASSTSAIFFLFLLRRLFTSPSGWCASGTGWRRARSAVCRYLHVAAALAAELQGDLAIQTASSLSAAAAGCSCPSSGIRWSSVLDSTPSSSGPVDDVIARPETDLLSTLGGRRRPDAAALSLPWWWRPPDAEALQPSFDDWWRLWWWCTWHT